MKTAPGRRADGKRPERVRRRFTHAERVAALLMLDAKCGASVRAVARQFGIPETTLRRWASGERSPAAKDAVPLHRGQLADVFERAAWECLAVNPERLGRATFLQLIRAAGQAADALVRLRTLLTLHAPSARDLSPDALTPEQQEQFATILGSGRAPNDTAVLSALSAPTAGSHTAGGPTR